MVNLQNVATSGTTVKDLQLAMAAYLFEFCNALCIGKKNVSESGGFESLAHTYN